MVPPASDLVLSVGAVNAPTPTRPMSDPALQRGLTEWGKLLNRGVYKLPAIGPEGSYILFAVKANHELTPTRFMSIPFGGDVCGAVEKLEDELDRYDPVTDQTRRLFIQAVS